MLITKNIQIGYHQHTVFSDININALDGELIALIGPNGIGKSTLLKTIAGLLPCIRGEILIDEINIKMLKGKKRANKISFVFSGFNPAGNMTVYELVALGRTPYTNLIGHLKKEDKMFVSKVLKETGLFLLQNRCLTEISDGERQKTLIARALVQDTDMIILDEPTAFLDIANKFEIIQLLHQLATKNKKTIIFSTHDLNMSINSADKMWLMLQDNSVKEGAPEDLIIENCFDGLFQNKNMNFNNQTGFFEQNLPTNKTISLSGDKSIIYTWTKKALEKAGFNILANSNQQIKIKNNKGTTEWVYVEKKNKTLFTSIYSLTRFLKNK